MKKIISVLALSTLVFGSAAAKTSVKLSYKNSGSFWAYNNNGESGTGAYSGVPGFNNDRPAVNPYLADPIYAAGSPNQKDYATYDEYFAAKAKYDAVDKLKKAYDLAKEQEAWDKTKKTLEDSNGYQELKTSMTFFDLDVISAGDTLELGASGDYLSYTAKLKPSLAGKFVVDTNQLTATWGAFKLVGGWNNGAIHGGFRTEADAGNKEGAFFESWKLGSIFNKSYAEFSDNQIEIGGTSKRLFTQAGFTLAVPNSDAKLELKGALLLPWQWTDSESLLTAGDEIDGGHLSFTGFAIFDMPKVIKAEAFVKAKPHCDVHSVEHEAVFVPGAYVQLLAVPGLTATFGGSMAVVEYDISDFNFDLRARYAFTDSFSLTYMGNVSVINDTNFHRRDMRGAQVHTEYAYNTASEVATAIGAYNLGSGKAKSSSIYTNKAMWNMLNAQFIMNDAVRFNLGVAAVTDLANGLDYADQKGEGTILSITPSVEFFASKAASFWIGFNVTMQGIGKELHDVDHAGNIQLRDDGKTWSGYDYTVTGQGMDLGFAVPFTFRVRM